MCCPLHGNWISKVCGLPAQSHPLLHCRILMLAHRKWHRFQSSACVIAVLRGLVLRVHKMHGIGAQGKGMGQDKVRPACTHTRTHTHSL